MRLNKVPLSIAMHIMMNDDQAVSMTDDEVVVPTEETTPDLGTDEAGGAMPVEGGDEEVAA